MDGDSQQGRTQYVLGFLALVGLTALELITIRLEVGRAARVMSLAGLAMAKVALLLWVFMDLRARSRIVQVLAISPLLLAPGFTVVLMLDVVYRAVGAR